MDEIRKRRTMRSLVNVGMVEMKPTGRWGLTPSGRDFLDQIDLMHELDDRPPAAREGQREGRSTPVRGRKGRG